MNALGSVSIPRHDELEIVMLNEINRLTGTVAQTNSLPVAAPATASVPARGSVVPVSSLLVLDDEAFVNALYHSVLGREPDPEGLRHHLALLRAGGNKTNLIASLRASSEGVAFGSTLVGIVPRSRLDRLYALPLIGRPLRFLAALMRVRSLKHDVQGLHDVILTLQHVIRDQQDAIHALQDVGRSQLPLLTDLRGRAADLPTRQQFNAVSSNVTSLSQRLEKTENIIGDRLRAAEADIARRLADLDQQVAEPWSEPLLQLADQQEVLSDQFHTLDKALGEAALLQQAVIRLNEAFGPVAEGQGWTETGAARVARAAESLRLQEGRIRHAETLAETTYAEMLDQRRRLGLLLEAVRRHPDQPLDSDQQAILADTQDHLLDALYVEFEARFRGSRELIKQRQHVHLPVITEAGAGTRERPVIDVGAGRGEWLELLREQGLVARGIDLNTAMVEACREHGLDCIFGDAVGELAKLASGSVGAVTGFHIIEHLPFRVMVALFDEALRVLAPGGVILFETPNPANLQVGSRWFYLDPTHNNPLPGEMVSMIAEARGFNRVRIQPLHPMTQTFDAIDKRLGEQLDALLHGPQDYALIAYKA